MGPWSLRRQGPGWDRHGTKMCLGAQRQPEALSASTAREPGEDATGRRKPSLTSGADAMFTWPLSDRQPAKPFAWEKGAKLNMSHGSLRSGAPSSVPSSLPSSLIGPGPLLIPLSHQPQGRYFVWPHLCMPNSTPAPLRIQGQAMVSFSR